MAGNENAKIDQNRERTLLGITDDASAEIRRLLVDATTGRLKVSATVSGSIGDVVGPGSAVNNNVVFFDGTTGKLIKDSGITLSGSNTGDQTSIVGISGTQTQFNTACSNGTFLFSGGALGTPSSGVATNLTGTASGLTAGNVTTNANLTGVVTSVGNATAIADKAIAIAKLADGTDGELITWDASGVIATVAVGTAGQVLTSNGVGAAPTFQAAAGGGDVSKVGTPVDNQVGVWTGDGTIEGTIGLTYNGSNLQLTGDIGSTGTRITKGWFVDLQVTNAIAGSITGNAATVSTITGLAPDTATTQATQAAITSAANLVTVGALTSGSIASGFGTINIGTSNAISCGTIELGHASDTTLSRISAGVVAIEGVNILTTSSTATLTNKTFDANGTGNSLSNVDVADLADGTDGELITWDASGNPATVAAGTADQVLTSNGAGAAPTFQAAGGGGGAWTLMDYSSVSSIAGGTRTDITGLDLDSDGAYKIIIRAKATSNAEFRATVNDISTGLLYVNWTFLDSSGTFSDSQRSTQTIFAMSNDTSGSGDRHQAEILITKESGENPLIQWESSGSTGATSVPYKCSGSAIVNATTNVTQFNFDLSATYDAEIWILKPNQS